ncbi:hypothetical protein [Joostella sp. CR20]|uniref:hypothetical protein n=1 Tax=Joostella sp. CR20 TaxID=2804312 RepID=UPI00313AD91E
MKKEHGKKKANISKIKEDCLADKDYLNEIMLLINNNIDEFYENTEIYLKAKDRFSISRAAHKVKNGLEMVQAFTLLDYLDMIQKECQYVDTYQNIKQLITDFKVEYQLVVIELQSQIDEMEA